MYAGPLVFCLGFFTVFDDFFNLLFTFEREECFVVFLFMSAVDAIFLLTAFFFACFFGLGFFTMAFLLDTISLHPL